MLNIKAGLARIAASILPQPKAGNNGCLDLGSNEYRAFGVCKEGPEHKQHKLYGGLRTISLDMLASKLNNNNKI